MKMFCRCHACRCDLGNMMVTRGKAHAYEGITNLHIRNNAYEEITNLRTQNAIENSDNFNTWIDSKDIEKKIYETSFNNQEVEGEHCTCDHCSCSHGFGLLVHK